MFEKILVVDDEKSIVKALSFALKKEGYTVFEAFDGIDALKKVEEYHPNLIILDVMMPYMNGYDFCKQTLAKNIGILMITAKNDITDKVLGLELGADDYITKPFDIREVLARVKSLLRRLDKNLSTSNELSLDIGDLTLIYENQQALLNNEDLYLTPKEFMLLYILLKNPLKVYSREVLLNEVWGMEYIGVTRTVDTHIQRLRKKLGSYENLIATVHGIGYKGRINI